jgi:aryl-alcohol dehydrogenase-like predicted oxidoreductase
MDAVDASLRRLQTDYIDLYQAHFDHRETPLEETLRAFDDLIRQGKVRYVGASNYAAWRLTRALWESDRHGYARYDSLQPHYNLAYRDEYERELEPLCLEQGLGVIPYSPLAGGFLSGKYRRSEPLPASARATGIQQRYMNERGFAVLERVERVAADRGARPAQVALAWLLARPSMTAPIIGANSVAQLRETLHAAELRLGAEEMTMLEMAGAAPAPPS